MRYSRAGWVLGAATVALLAWYGRSPADGPSTPRSGEKEFRAKVAEVHCIDAPYTLLSDVEVRRIESRAFIVGKYADDESERFKGATIWYPLDKVTQVFEFDSIEAARRSP